VDIDRANAALLDSWELDLRSPIRPNTRPKREGTIGLYLAEARRFADWLSRAGRPTSAPGDLAGVERGDVAAWIADLRVAGLSPYTVRNRWIVMRSLYGWAAHEELIAGNPTARVNVAKVDEPPPDVLDDAAITTLLAACRGTDFNDRRDLALIRLLLATGLRASELCALTVDDVDLRSRIVAVADGKGGRARLARFDPATAAAIDRYKRVRGRHRHAGRHELWIGHRGPLSRKGLGPILDRRAAVAGLKHVHPHMLRHTYAHRMKRAGASFEDLGQLGGWSSPEVMRRYGQSLAVERSLEAYDRLDPMAGL
jgi:site-specific recombinase XerD